MNKEVKKEEQNGHSSIHHLKCIQSRTKKHTHTSHTLLHQIQSFFSDHLTALEPRAFLPSLMHGMGDRITHFNYADMLYIHYRRKPKHAATCAAQQRKNKSWEFLHALVQHWK